MLVATAEKLHLLRGRGHHNRERLASRVNHLVFLAALDDAITCQPRQDRQGEIAANRLVDKKSLPFAIFRGEGKTGRNRLARFMAAQGYALDRHAATL